MPGGGPNCDDPLGRGRGMPLPFGIPFGTPLDMERGVDWDIRGRGEGTDGEPGIVGAGVAAASAFGRWRFIVLRLCRTA